MNIGQWTMDIGHGQAQWTLDDGHSSMQNGTFDNGQRAIDNGK